MTAAPFTKTAPPPLARPAVTASGPLSPRLATYTAKHPARSLCPLVATSYLQPFLGLLCHNDVIKERLIDSRVAGGELYRRPCVLD
jgi:hypothetical protein